MYDCTKRKSLRDCTVDDLIAELTKLPHDTKVLCCGDDIVYIHVEKDLSVVSIDTEDLDECYDEQIDS